MNCEKIRELLLTDYIDGELGRAAAEGVAAHLAKCASCKAYEATVRGSAVEPFRVARRMTPGEHVWEGIERSIETDRSARREGRPFAFPKPAFIMATVAMLLVVFALFARQYHAEGKALNLYIADQMAFFAEANGSGVISDEDLYTLNGDGKGVTA